MVKRAKRPKVKPPQLTPMERYREGTRIALRRAARREQEINQLLRTVDRLERKVRADMNAFVHRHAAGLGWQLVAVEPVEEPES